LVSRINLMKNTMYAESGTIEHDMPTLNTIEETVSPYPSLLTGSITRCSGSFFHLIAEAVNIDATAVMHPNIPMKDQSTVPVCSLFKISLIFARSSISTFSCPQQKHQLTRQDINLTTTASLLS
jgi:hypothetical protein